MKKLIARLPILYLSKQYAIGDEIPASDPKMVDAWLENKAAEWEEVIQQEAVAMSQQSREESLNHGNIQDEAELNKVEIEPNEEGSKKTKQEETDEEPKKETKEESSNNEVKPITRRNKK